ncbi:amino acid permease [Heyndrickxia sp. NPDC080065]|uniref:amino acid permease n=1 Tax=Heyndrickxia sp. NPDC080065 TaxID=3390568 RepID=UPI003CFD38B0
MSKVKRGGSENNLKWWQLSVIGVGCIIGTGFFLGTSIGIKLAGPSYVFSLVTASIATYFVYEALAKMTINEPLEGSFRSYAKKAYGKWAGFCSGWVYWCAEMLIMGSQMTALSIFSRFWFPQVPLWLFAAGYAVLGILVVIIGTKGFDRLESLFAVVKFAAILMFIIIALISLFGLIDKGNNHNPPNTINEIFPHKVFGLWSSLIFAFYAFGGIEIMGIMSTRLQNKMDATKSGKVMLLLIVIIYVISVGLAVSMDSWQAFNSSKSPFVTALDDHHLPFYPHVFNGALIIAGFSTMVASLFGVTTMLAILAKDHDAPSIFAKENVTRKNQRQRPPLPALGLSIFGLVVSIIFSLIMPDKIYEYITTAAGLMLIYNWLFILITSNKLLKLTFFSQIKRYIGIVIIVIAITGTLVKDASRPGFFISLLFLAVIGLAVWKRNHFWQKHNK